MARKIIQAELQDNNMIAEIEMEDTISFKTLLSRLCNEGHLVTGESYYIKTPEGEAIRDNDQLRVHRMDQFVITKDKDWKPPSAINDVEEEISKVSGTAIKDDEEWIWLTPLLKDSSWADLNMQTQLFELNDIVFNNDLSVSLRVLIQYSISDARIASTQTAVDRSMKMQQVMVNTAMIECKSRPFSSMKDRMELLEHLTEKMDGYLSAHMELKWGVKNHSLVVASFKTE
jgi:hypothetical protein